MNVDFIDLNAQYQSIQAEIDHAITQVIQDAAFIKSEVVRQFEEQFADYLGVDEMISCGNGTDALEMILKAWDIGAGDEVIVPAISWISTSEVVATAGAQPVFADVDPDCNLNPEMLEHLITKKTKAIIVVHLYGRPAAMQRIVQVAKRHGIKVLEDCAQAHGAEIEGRKVGTWGDAGSFSFFPTKNLGAFGDAGAVVTNSIETADKIRKIANHGQSQRHVHTVHGRNSRMDGLQAAVLKVKLNYLDQWTDLRIQKAARYNDLLKNVDGITVPRPSVSDRHVYHLYVVRASHRTLLMEQLRQHNVAALIHYPTALPFQPCYHHLNPDPEDFPQATVLQNEILSLPLYPEIPETHILKVVDVIKSCRTS